MKRNFFLMQALLKPQTRFSMGQIYPKTRTADNNTIILLLLHTAHKYFNV